MKPVNLPTGAQRNVETGLVWREVYNGAGGITLDLPMQTTFRVSAAADVTVTVGGVLAMTMRTGEVERFNTGAGPSDTKDTVKVIIGAGAARVQVAEEKDPGRRVR
jgi:hypothetical protein